MAGDICPWWMGYVLTNPIRRFLEKPDEILGAYISNGMTVLDFGCAMGFFTLPAARLAGETGRVIAVDLQEKMLRSLRRRVTKAGLTGRVDIRLCSETDLAISDLKGQIDLALAIHVVHEVPDAPALLREIYATVKPGGRLLLIEPAGHVDADHFGETVKIAVEAGFRPSEPPGIKWGRSALFTKPN
jgi:ubiquinone/menaquinone biosynthesis C-methylase UbiE